MRAEHHHKNSASRHQHHLRQRHAFEAPHTVAQHQQYHARQAAQAAQKLIKPARAKAPLAHAITAQRLAHGYAHTLQHRPDGRQQRHQQPGRQLRSHNLRQQLVAGPGHVQDAQDIAGQQHAAERAQRNSHGNSKQSIHNYTRQIDAADLAAQCTHCFHDANLRHLLHQNCVDGVDHQCHAQKQRSHGHHG